MGGRHCDVGKVSVSFIGTYWQQAVNIMPLLYFNSACLLCGHHLLSITPLVGREGRVGVWGIGRHSMVRGIGRHGMVEVGDG